MKTESPSLLMLSLACVLLVKFLITFAGNSTRTSTRERNAFTLPLVLMRVATGASTFTCTDGCSTTSRTSLTQRFQEESSPSTDQFAQLQADVARNKMSSGAGGALFTLLGVGDDLDSSHCCKDSPCFRWEHFAREPRGANLKRNGCNADGSCNCFPPCLSAGPCANKLASDDTRMALK